MGASFRPRSPALDGVDDGSEVSVSEREQIQERIHSLLTYMRFPHSFDRK
jgi:hypothetical protein